MLVIFGTAPRTKVLADGEFHCPFEGQTRHYEHKQVSDWFTLFFIPIFKWRDSGEYVECGYCHTRYPPSVLGKEKA